MQINPDLRSCFAESNDPHAVHERTLVFDRTQSRALRFPRGETLVISRRGDGIAFVGSTRFFPSEKSKDPFNKKNSKSSSSSASLIQRVARSRTKVVKNKENNRFLSQAYFN